MIHFRKMFNDNCCKVNYRQGLAKAGDFAWRYLHGAVEKVHLITPCPPRGV